MKILLIEDEIGLADALCHTFKSQNYSAVSCFDGESGLYEAMTGIYDVVILDVMLPKLDGFEVLKQLRKAGIHTPVLMLTAKSDIQSRVDGLDCGADYYLTKPFEVAELLACIRAITRRPDTLEAEEPGFGDIVLQTRQGGIFCKTTQQFVKMGIKELLLLETLIRNRGNITEKETLIEKVWGFDSDSEYNNLEVYISFIRKKLGFVGSSVKIKSTRGIGYSLEE